VENGRINMFSSRLWRFLSEKKRKKMKKSEKKHVQ